MALVQRCSAGSSAHDSGGAGQGNRNERVGRGMRTVFTWRWQFLRNSYQLLDLRIWDLRNSSSAIFACNKLHSPFFTPRSLHVRCRSTNSGSGAQERRASEHALSFLAPQVMCNIYMPLGPSIKLSCFPNIAISLLKLNSLCAHYFLVDSRQFSEVIPIAHACGLQLFLILGM